jgi:hypothetical protein
MDIEEKGFRPGFWPFGTVKCVYVCQTYRKNPPERKPVREPGPEEFAS